jgi:hypothetical protein
MRKILIIAILAFTGIQLGNAQEIGVRFGNIVGNDVAIDFAWAINAGRIHADVSFGNGVGVEALYDFLYGSLGDEDLYYYVGLGGYAWLGDPLGLGLSGEAGIEYRFQSLPLALGIDWRPTFAILQNTNFHADRFGLNLRFVF